MKSLTITNKNITREALLTMAEKKIDGAWIGIRIAGMLLILSGWKSTAVADLFNLSRFSVISWIKKANEEGATSIKDKPRPGRPGKLVPLQLILSKISPLEIFFISNGVNRKFLEIISCNGTNIIYSGIQAYV